MFLFSVLCGLCLLVSTNAAQCSRPADCDFRSNFCGWNRTGWNRHNVRWYAYLRKNRTFGYFLSGEACGTNSTHCLKFRFYLKKKDTSLTVSLKRGKTDTVLWRYAVPSEGWKNGSVPITSNESYQVNISGWQKQTGGNKFIRVDNIIFSDSNCTLTPSSAAVPATTTTRSTPPTTTTKPPTTTPTPSTTTTTTTSPTNQPSSTPSSSSTSTLRTVTNGSSTYTGAIRAEADSSLDAGVVAGIVFAALLVTAASAVAVLFCFVSPRRRQRLFFIKRCCAAEGKDNTTDRSFHNNAYDHDADDIIVSGGTADVTKKPVANDVTPSYVNVGLRESSAGEYNEVGDIDEDLPFTATFSSSSPYSPPSSAFQSGTPVYFNANVTQSTQNDFKDAQPPRRSPEDVQYMNVASVGTASIQQPVAASVGSSSRDDNSVYSLAMPVGVKDPDSLGDDRSGDRGTYEIVEDDEIWLGQETERRLRQNEGRNQVLEEGRDREESLEREQRQNGEAENLYHTLDLTGVVSENADEGGVYHILDATPASELSDQEQQPTTSIYHIPRNEALQTRNGPQHPSQGPGKQRSHTDMMGGGNEEDSVYSHLGDALPKVCGEAGLRSNARVEGPGADGDHEDVYNHLGDGGEDLYSEMDHEQKRTIVIDGDYSHLC